MAREGVRLIVMQRQLEHLGIPSVYLQGIDSGEIIKTSALDARDDSRQRVAAALIGPEQAAARRALR